MTEIEQNGRISITHIAQLAGTGALLLGMFGLWWASADPKARLDKIEANQLDNRKELNESLTSLRKDLGEILNHYVTLREHNDLLAQVATLMPKVQFEAWKSERDFRTERFEEEVKDIRARINSSHECIDIKEDLKKLLQQNNKK